MTTTLASYILKGMKFREKENVRMPKNKINSNDCKVGIL